MKILITKEWMGNEVGTILRLPPQMAMAIVTHYGVAEVVSDDEDTIKDFEPEKDRMVKKNDTKRK